MARPFRIGPAGANVGPPTPCRGQGVGCYLNNAKVEPIKNTAAICADVLSLTHSLPLTAVPPTAAIRRECPLWPGYATNGPWNIRLCCAAPFEVGYTASRKSPRIARRRPAVGTSGSVREYFLCVAILAVMRLWRRGRRQAARKAPVWLAVIVPCGSCT